MKDNEGHVYYVNDTVKDNEGHVYYVNDSEGEGQVYYLCYVMCEAHV